MRIIAVVAMATLLACCSTQSTSASDDEHYVIRHACYGRGVDKLAVANNRMIAQQVTIAWTCTNDPTDIWFDFR